MSGCRLGEWDRGVEESRCGSIGFFSVNFVWQILLCLFLCYNSKVGKLYEKIEENGWYIKRGQYERTYG